MNEHDIVRLTINLSSRKKPGVVHSIGTHAVLVGKFGSNAWIIEVRVSDESLVGGAWYETFEVYEHEFEKVEMSP